MSTNDFFAKACEELNIVPQNPNLDAIPTKYRKVMLDLYRQLVIMDWISEAPKKMQKLKAK